MLVREIIEQKRWQGSPQKKRQSIMGALRMRKIWGVIMMLLVELAFQLCSGFPVQAHQGVCVSRVTVGWADPGVFLAVSLGCQARFPAG